MVCQKLALRPCSNRCGAVFLHPIFEIGVFEVPFSIAQISDYPNFLRRSSEFWMANAPTFNEDAFEPPRNPGHHSVLFLRSSLLIVGVVDEFAPFGGGDGNAVVAIGGEDSVEVGEIDVGFGYQGGEPVTKVAGGGGDAYFVES